MVLTTLASGSAQTVSPLTPDERLMIESVLTIQRQANAECQLLPSVKAYADLLRRVNDRITKAHPGNTIDWTTGQLKAAAAPTK